MPVQAFERLVNEGRYVHAMRYFLALLKDETLSRKDLARAYHVAAVCRHATGQVYSALELAQLAESNAIAAGDEALLGRVWTNLIEFYRCVGDTAQALEYGEKWQANLALYPDLAYRVGRVYYNLALVHRNRRHNTKAIYYFDLALTHLHLEYVTTPEGDRKAPRAFLIQAHQMFAWMLYEIGRRDEADEQAEKAKDYLDEEAALQSDHQHVSHREAAQEQLLLQGLRAHVIGDAQSVIEITEEFLTDGSGSTQAQQFWALYMAGSAFVRLGHTRAATVAATVARDLAIELKQPQFMNKAAELKRQITMQKPEDEAG